MQSGRELKEARPLHLYVELVGVAAPATQKLDLVVGTAGGGGGRSGPASEAVTRERGLVDACGVKGLADARNEVCASEGCPVNREEGGRGGIRDSVPEEPAECGDRAGRDVRDGSEGDSDPFAEGIRLGRGDGEQRIGEVRRKLDQGAREGNVGVEGGLDRCELPAAEEASVGDAVSRVGHKPLFSFSIFFSFSFLFRIT